MKLANLTPEQIEERRLAKVAYFKEYRLNHLKEQAAYSKKCNLLRKMKSEEANKDK